jgi:hypothetical protein
MHSSTAQETPYLLERVDTLACGIEGVLFVKKLVTDLRADLRIRSLRSRTGTYHKMHAREEKVSTRATRTIHVY